MKYKIYRSIISNYGCERCYFIDEYSGSVMIQDFYSEPIKCGEEFFYCSELRASFYSNIDQVNDNPFLKFICETDEKDKIVELIEISRKIEKL